MTPEIKVIHVSQQVAKNGNKYQVVHCVINVMGREFVRKFYVFGAAVPRPLRPMDANISEDIIE